MVITDHFSSRTYPLLSDALTFARQLCDEYNLTDDEKNREIKKRENEEKRNIESFKLLKTELISIMKDKKISWSRKRHCFDLLSRCLVRIDLDLTQVRKNVFIREKYSESYP